MAFQRIQRLLMAAALVLAAFYVGSYAGLSRRGCAEASQLGMKGFYYLAPENSDRWRGRQRCCVWLFGPINAVDQWLADGEAPASEPMWGLSP